MHKLPHVYKSRHGVWYIRCQDAGKESRLSLHTKDWSRAKVLALKFNLAWAMGMKKFDVIFPSGLQVKDINTDSDLDRFLRLAEDPQVKKYMELSNATPQPPRQGESFGRASAPSAQATLPQRSKLLSEVVDLYLAEKTLDNTPKTLKEKKSVFDEVMQLFSDADINAYRPETAVSYKNRLIGEKLSALRINKKISFLKDLFTYATENHMFFEKNPFEGLAISKKSKLRSKVQSYQEFTTQELKQIFETSEYKRFMNKPDYLYLPYLALLTGARIEELASLRTDQIKQEGEVWYFDIQDGKNFNSIRRIPVHQSILKSTFWTYFEKTKLSKKSQIFPHLKPGANGYSKNCSRRFGEYLDKINIKDSRKVFHSFRSTFINQMTNLGTHPAILMGIVGHYEQNKLDFSSAHFQTYQQIKPLEVLNAAIQKLEYGGVLLDF